MIKAGTNQEVQIPLAGTLAPGAGIVLMLHEDAGTMGTFDGAEDTPVISMRGFMRFTITSLRHTEKR